MNINLENFLASVKGTSYFKSLKATVIKLKESLGLMSIVLLLAGCAAFSGRETAGEYVDDAGITTSVKNEIFQDPKLKMFQIHVETFKNQVQLSGFVDSQREAARAGQIARGVKGVQGVNNNLVVRKHTLKHH
jgi:hyperosmotically inducible protein